MNASGAPARLAAVARREFLERVRSRTFLVGTVLGPVVMAGVLLVPSLVMSRQRGEPLRIAVLDVQGGLGRAVEDSLARRRAAGSPRFEVRPAPPGPEAEARAALRQAVIAGTLDGYVYLPVDALERSAAEYHGRNVSNLMDIGLLDTAVEEALVASRLASAGLSADQVRGITQRLDLKTVRLSASGDREDRGASFMLSMLLMTLLYTALLMWGAAVMNGVIEEKASRVVELVVSSLPTWSLFAGKLLGVGGAGLAQFAVWGASLAALSAAAAPLALAAGARLPEVSPLLVAAFVACFLVGYFLYGGLYAAVGAAVNSPQEAQPLVFPVMAPLLAAFVFFPTVLGSPDSALSTWLSMVPLFAPLLMFLRVAASPPPAWQLLLCLGLSLAAVTAVVWVAARIYRVGILMYGKRPTLPELLRWTRRA